MRNKNTTSVQALITLIVIIILFINNNHIYTAKNFITHCKHPGMKQTINKMPKNWGIFWVPSISYHLVVNIAMAFIQTGARSWLRLMQSKLSDLCFRQRSTNSQQSSWNLKMYKCYLNLGGRGGVKLLITRQYHLLLMQKLLQTIGRFKNLWDLTVQLADNLVYGLLPGGINIFACHNSIEKLP